ncbi:hypothetical protein PR048_030772 [Dryococelus australis]|uniref:Acyltransferase n=1 Tax=Dryococelus australis TaxID=614101 RepID=A0ABQ9G9U5_9NEOP|nr:hypothetical protein PR048_030772 [Dryococelus australis]
MRVIEVSMEQRRNEGGGGGGTGDPRENPPTNDIARHDSHLRKSGAPCWGLKPVRLGPSREPTRVNRGKEQLLNERVGGNGRSPRKPADQRHRPARLPLAKIQKCPGAGDLARFALAGGEQANRSVTEPPPQPGPRQDCLDWRMRRTANEALDRLAGGSWMVFLVFSPLVSWAILSYVMFTSYYWLALLYLAWMWLDRHTPYRGGRRIEWTRKLGLWRRAASYFPLRLVKTAELPPDRNYILAVYPHGVLSYGGFLGFCTDAVAISEALSGITARPFTLNVNFYMPFVRDFLMALGFCSVSADSLGYFLEDRKAGNALGLVAGGAAEALLSEPGTYRLMTNRRKGIVRLAIKHG